jgi:hypothetical protein
LAAGGKGFHFLVFFGYKVILCCLGISISLV